MAIIFRATFLSGLIPKVDITMDDTAPELAGSSVDYNIKWRPKGGDYEPLAAGNIAAGVASQHVGTYPINHFGDVEVLIEQVLNQRYAIVNKAGWWDDKFTVSPASALNSSGVITGPATLTLKPSYRNMLLAKPGYPVYVGTFFHNYAVGVSGQTVINRLNKGYTVASGNAWRPDTTWLQITNGQAGASERTVGSYHRLNNTEQGSSYGYKIVGRKTTGIGGLEPDASAGLEIAIGRPTTANEWAAAELDPANNADEYLGTFGATSVDFQIKLASGATAASVKAGSVTTTYGMRQITSAPSSFSHTFTQDYVNPVPGPDPDPPEDRPPPDPEKPTERLDLPYAYIVSKEMVGVAFEEFDATNIISVLENEKINKDEIIDLEGYTYPIVYDKGNGTRFGDKTFVFRCKHAQELKRLEQVLKDGKFFIYIPDFWNKHIENGYYYYKSYSYFNEGNRLKTKSVQITFNGCRKITPEDVGEIGFGLWNYGVLKDYKKSEGFNFAKVPEYFEDYRAVRRGM